LKRFRFHYLAEAELLEQTQYYEKQATGLGARYRIEIEAVLLRVRTMPRFGSPYLHGCRRVLPKVFPVSIVYLERDDEILIIAVAPSSREPGYWNERQSG
jgi:plasmid stabilization system protein ParE